MEVYNKILSRCKEDEKQFIMQIVSEYKKKKYPDIKESTLAVDL